MTSSTYFVLVQILIFVTTKTYGEDFHSFADLKEGSRLRLKIANTDCDFTGEKSSCNYLFTKTSGKCTLTLTLRQLFPSIDLHILSKGFMITDKLSVNELAFDTCTGKESIMFKMKSEESYAIVQPYIVLAAESNFIIGWKHNDDALTFKKMKLEITGLTSIANDHAVGITLDKPLERDDFDMRYVLRSVSSKDFFLQFSVDSNGFKPVTDSTTPAIPVFPEGMESEKERLASMELHFQDAEVSGIFAPGQGFELTVKGSLVAPELLGDAEKLYLIIQDFKKPESEPTKETYDTPAAALFASYEGEKVPAIVYALTGHSLPLDLEIFKDVTEICITAATRGINFVNSPELRAITDRFSPSKGLDVIEQGLKLMHFSPISDDGIKDENNEILRKILFRVPITKKKISWKSAQAMKANMRRMAYLAWNEPKGVNRFPISHATKCLFGELYYLKSDNSINVEFNLTEPVRVLEGGIVTLASSTLKLQSTRHPTRGVYRRWQISGWGKETILDEWESITLEDTGTRTQVTAQSNLFSMKEVSERAGATFLPEEYTEPFRYCLEFPVSDLDFIAVFEQPKILRFKGTSEFLNHDDKNHKVEVIRFMKPDGHPGIKVGLLFKKTPLFMILNRMSENEKRSQSTWIRPQSTAVVFKKEPSDYEFDRHIMAAVDIMENFESGIGMLVENLDLSVCGMNGVTVSMCAFLQSIFGVDLTVDLYGRMYSDRMRVQGKGVNSVALGEGIEFRNVRLKIRSSPRGDKTALVGFVYFKRTEETFKASIYMTGSNNLIFKVNSDERGSEDMFPLPCIKMRPIQANFQIPPQRVQFMEFTSRLHIGCSAEDKIEIPGSHTRQYVGLADPSDNRFFAVKSQLSLKKILQSFNMNEPLTLLHDSTFREQVVIAYNSKEEVWQIPEVDYIISQGFWFHGKLYLKTGGIFQASIKLTGSLTTSVGIEARVELAPILYGHQTEAKRELTHKKTSLFLYRKIGQTDAGPTLIVTFSNAGGTQVVEGYLETYGFEGPFVMHTAVIGRKSTSYVIYIRGSVYKEVDGVQLKLSAQGEGIPINMDFKYEMDLTSRVVNRGSADIREACVQVQTDAKEGKRKAADAVTQIGATREIYASKLARYTREMEGIVKDIRNVNDGIDSACQTISQSCIDKCKTVSLAGIEWKEDCESPSGSRDMKCMVWNEDKEKCVHVFCLLKCEAKKISSSSVACKNLNKIRIMVNRYKELKILSQNVEQLLSLVDGAVEIADSAKILIEEKTNAEKEISALLAKPSEVPLITFNELKVSSYLKDIKAPCLPFDMDFVLKTETPKSYKGKHDLCFNGEFFKNVGVQVLRSTYPVVDEMYKALEEAEMRYFRIDRIQKSLAKTEKEMKSSVQPRPIPSKKSTIADESHSLTDLVEGELMRISKRRLPRFTTKGDHTMLAFQQYSPWAMAKRSHPFASVKAPMPAKKYNATLLEDRNPCLQARKVVAHYRDIISGVRSVADNYHKGQQSYHKNRDTIKQQLQESYEELFKMANASYLRPEEIKDMFFWFDYTKSGMKNYLQYFSAHLAQHNKLGLNLWRGELKGLYGSNSITRELDNLWHDAYTRSNIGKVMKRSSIESFNDVKQKIAELMENPSLTLEKASPMIEELHGRIERIHTKTLACH